MNTNSIDFFQKEEVNKVNHESELILAVWKIKNPENMGQIIRLANNIGASGILFIREKTEVREHRIRKTAGFSFSQMKWKIISVNDFIQLINNNIKLVALETCEGAKNIFQTKLPGKMILLAGSESYGLPAEILDRSNLKVYIPMPGYCKSMNISHALSVAAFEWYRQNS